MAGPVNPGGAYGSGRTARNALTVMRGMPTLASELSGFGPARRSASGGAYDFMRGLFGAEELQALQAAQEQQAAAQGQVVPVAPMVEQAAAAAPVAVAPPGGWRGPPFLLPGAAPVARPPAPVAQAAPVAPEMVGPAQVSSGPLAQSSVSLGLQPVQPARAYAPTDPGKSMTERYGDALAAQSWGVNLVEHDKNQRMDMVQQLRTTPQYQAEFIAALTNSGGNRQAAQALADQRFLAASDNPNLALGLTENDTSAAISALSAQQQSAALESQNATLPNRLSGAAAEAGYFGSGIMPYGTGMNAPGYMTPGVAGPTVMSGYSNDPEYYTGASRALGLGSDTQKRIDAGQAAIQQLAAATASSSAAQARAQAEAEARAMREDPAMKQRALIEELKIKQMFGWNKGGKNDDILSLLAPKP